MVLEEYRNALGPQASLLLEVPEEEEVVYPGSPEASDDEEELVGLFCVYSKRREGGTRELTVGYLQRLISAQEL